MLYGLIVVPTYSILYSDYYIVIVWLIWLLVSRYLKLVHYFYFNPTKIIYLPVYIVFQYFNVGVSFYTLFTLHNRTWGSRSINIVNNQIVRENEVETENNTTENIEMQNID